MLAQCRFFGAFHIIREAVGFVSWIRRAFGLMCRGRQIGERLAELGIDPLRRHKGLWCWWQESAGNGRRDEGLLQKLLASLGADHDLAERAVILRQQHHCCRLALGGRLSDDLRATDTDGHGRRVDHQGIQTDMGGLATDE